MLRVNEILKATHGRLILGRKDSLIGNFFIDSRSPLPQGAFIALKGKNFDGHNFINQVLKTGAVCVIASKIVDINLRQHKINYILVKDTQKALADIARFKREKYNIPVIAITGSAGKTTAKEMVAWVLSKKFNVLSNEGSKNNHIGLPLTLLKLNQSHDIAVLELGTNHFGEIEYLAKICQPNIALITNIGSAHLEYFKNLQGVLKEKYRLISYLKKPAIVILNADDDLLKIKLAANLKKEVIFSFGINNKSDFQASDFKNLAHSTTFFVNNKHKAVLKIPGAHNIYNALAAISIARIFAMEYKDIKQRLSRFKLPQSRFNFIKLNSISIIDDTYNSNPLSLKQALETLAGLKIRGRKIFVMGDMLELGSFKESFHSQAGIHTAKICDVFIAVGELSKFAASAAKSCGLDSRNIFTCKSSKEAKDILFNKIFPNENDLILIKGSRGMKMEEVFKI